MTLKGGTNQACAACKYQRRKCTKECSLAPYFPADQPKVFQNVHKLFGVKNIQKLLRNLHPTLHNEAMSSIIYQAKVRDRFPVYGCIQVIQLLQNQIQQYEDELYALHSALSICRHQHDELQSSSNSDAPFCHITTPSQLQLGIPFPPNNTSKLYPQNSQLCEQHYNSEDVLTPVSQNHSYSSSNSPYSSTYIDVKQSSMWIQHPGCNDNNNSENENAMPIQPQLVAITSDSKTTQQGVFHNYDDMHSFYDTIDDVDDRQSYIESKQTYDSSSVSSVKDTIHFTEHIAENDMKTAVHDSVLPASSTNDRDGIFDDFSPKPFTYTT